MLYGLTDRRHFLKHAAGISAMGLPAMQFLSTLHAAAGPTAKPIDSKRPRSLVIFWFNGGYSDGDFYDLKPGHQNNGESKAMKTAVSGIEINEMLPTIAGQMNNLAIIRSHTKTEGDHARGSQLTATSRTPNPLVPFPHIGSVYSYVNKEFEGDLPSFISVGGGGGSPGFLGMKFAPFVVGNPGSKPENVSPPSKDLEERMMHELGCSSISNPASNRARTWRRTAKMRPRRTRKCTRRL